MNCYHSIPDFAAALRLLKQMGDHPATESLLWIEGLEQAIARRPEKFTKLVTPAEKKHLEQMLERAPGVTRKKPAPRKAAAKKAAAPKKNATKKSAAYF